MKPTFSGWKVVGLTGAATAFGHVGVDGRYPGMHADEVGGHRFRVSGKVRERVRGIWRRAGVAESRYIPEYFDNGGLMHQRLTSENHQPGNSQDARFG